MKKDTLSPVIQLLDLVWHNTNKAIGHSWERLNHCMHSALRLCIGSGFACTAEDFAHVAGNYRSGYWLGESTEGLYALAVLVGNTAAVAGYESWKGRCPFIADEVSPPRWGHEGYLHLTGTRDRERLFVGCTFPWKGETAKVTSFARDGLSLIACTYHPGKSNGYSMRDESRVKKRHRITREDILADRAERKERAALLKEITALGCSSSAKKLLRAETQAEFNALPLKKIRAALAKLKREAA